MASIKQYPPEEEDLMNAKVMGALIAAIGSIVVAVVSGFYALQATRETAEAHRVSNDAIKQVNQVSEDSLGSLDQGQKLCRVLHKGWAEGLIVPRNWNVTLCVDYEKKTLGNGHQLGCIYANGTTLANPDGSLPSPNCGWN
jgi:hypothetical protein